MSSNLFSIFLWINKKLIYQNKFVLKHNICLLSGLQLIFFCKKKSRKVLAKTTFKLNWRKKRFFPSFFIEDVITFTRTHSHLQPCTSSGKKRKQLKEENNSKNKTISKGEQLTSKKEFGSKSLVSGLASREEESWRDYKIQL